ncbi:MAG: hypothetical protein L6277_16610 [Desulfobacterales bacterium]|nr:hypothetical protein [Pseudomonadota bacterium]MBU4354869.1 hypothetical protein [Pseudomonadota bacterium]MCG2773693.1 hypothetical protein [Desulfobacterales bacterium]
MSFDWQLYVSIAAKLLDGQRTNPNPREECLRTSISRYYYGVFCIARNHLKNQGEYLPDKEVHAYLRKVYIQSPNQFYNQIGKNLLKLWNKRRVADYDDDQIISLFDTTAAHQITFNVIQNLKKIGAIGP